MLSCEVGLKMNVLHPVNVPPSERSSQGETEKVALNMS